MRSPDRFSRIRVYARRTLRSTFWMGVTTFALLAGCYAWFALRNADAIYSNLQELPAADVGLVLGTSKKMADGSVNLYFASRMDAAAALYHSGRVLKLIVSGDNSEIWYNEPRDMKQALVARGVRPEDIIQDHAGFRTFDSMVRCREVFGQRRVIVVSQKFHLERALTIARWAGMEATGFAADTPDSAAGNFWLTLREGLARARTLLDCYILGTEPRFLGEPVNVFASR